MEKKEEGLQRNCNSKGSHVGSGGRVLHFMVAISYSDGYRQYIRPLSPCERSRRYLKKMGYAYRPTLRKGLLLHSDLKRRLKFASTDASTLWMKEIKFYFDFGVRI